MIVVFKARPLFRSSTTRDEIDIFFPKSYTSKPWYNRVRPRKDCGIVAIRIEVLNMVWC